jgi:hypothetical protein
MLERVFRALGDPGGRVLHIRDVDGVEQDYQSVPPFITVFNLHESWTYLGTGAELVDTDTVSPGIPAPESRHGGPSKRWHIPGIDIEHRPLVQRFRAYPAAESLGDTCRMADCRRAGTRIRHAPVPKGWESVEGA